MTRDEFAKLVGEAQRLSGAADGLTSAEIDLLFKVRSVSFFLSWSPEKEARHVVGRVFPLSDGLIGAEIDLLFKVWCCTQHSVISRGSEKLCSHP